MTDAVQVYEGSGERPVPPPSSRVFTNMNPQAVKWQAEEVHVTKVQRKPDEPDKLMLHLHEPSNKTIAEVVNLKKFLEDRVDDKMTIHVKPKVLFLINDEYTALGDVPTEVYKVTEFSNEAHSDGTLRSFGYHILVEDRGVA